MMTANPELKIVKPSFSEKFKSKNAPTISGVQTLLTALPIIKIGDVDDWTRLHPSEDDYWSCEMCFVRCRSRAPSATCCTSSMTTSRCSTCQPRRSSGIGWRWPASRTMCSFSASCRAKTSTTAWNADALKACHLAQTHWVQAMSRRSEGAEGYEIKFAQDQDAFPEPKWPTRSLDELLEVTFKDANIDHDRHPGLLRLIGAKQDLT